MYLNHELRQARVDLEMLFDHLHATATTEQLAESGDIAWKITMIRIRDAVLSAGGCADDASRLYDQLVNEDDLEGMRTALVQLQALIKAIA